MLSEKVLFALNNVEDAYLEETRLFLQRPRNRRTPPSRRRLARTILIAAILAALLAATAYTVGYTIQQKRQTEIRQQLKINENNVPGYMEFAVPDENGNECAEGKPATSLLSTFCDGKTVVAYVSIAPISREEAWAAVIENRHVMLSQRISNDPNLAEVNPDKSRGSERFEGNFLRPPIPEGTNMAELSLEAFFSQYYDDETQSLLLATGYRTDAVNINLPVYLNICLLDYESLSTSMNNWLDEQFSSYHPKILRNYGTVEILAANSAYREVDFRGRQIELINPVNQKPLKILSVRVFPNRIEWKITHEEIEGIFETKKEQASLERNFALQKEWLQYYDDFRRDAALAFQDGTVLKLLSEDGTLYNDRILTMISRWVSTVDLEKLVGLRIGEQQFPFLPTVSVVLSESGGNDSATVNTVQLQKTPELAPTSQMLPMPAANTLSEITAPGFTWYSNYPEAMKEAEAIGLPDSPMSMIDDHSLTPRWDFYRNTRTDYHYVLRCGGGILFPNAACDCFGYQADQVELYFLYNAQSGILHETKAQAVRLYMVEYVIHTRNHHAVYLDLLEKLKTQYGSHPMEDETGVCWVNSGGAMIGLAEMINTVDPNYSAVRIVLEAPGAEEKLDELIRIQRQVSH